MTPTLAKIEQRRIEGQEARQEDDRRCITSFHSQTAYRFPWIASDAEQTAYNEGYFGIKPRELTGGTSK